MSTMLERFLETMPSPNTKIAYRKDVGDFLKRFDIEITYNDFYRLSMPSISDQVAKYLIAIKKVDEHTGRVLNVQTYNRKRNALSSFFSYLTDWHNFPKNPVRIFKPLPTRKKSNTQALTGAEVRQILAYLKSNWDEKQNETEFRDYLIVLFLAHYALRRSELVSLRWEDFKPNEGKFEVIQKGHQPREKTLLPAHWQLLCEFRDQFDQTGKSPYVFHAIKPNRKTKLYQPLTVVYVFQVVKAVVESIVPHKHITPHSFRGTFIGLALDAGIDPAKIAHDTGHSSVKMVYYYDPRDHREDTAIEGVAKQFYCIFR